MAIVRRAHGAPCWERFTLAAWIHHGDVAVADDLVPLYAQGSMELHAAVQFGPEKALEGVAIAFAAGQSGMPFLEGIEAGAANDVKEGFFPLGAE